MNINRIEPRVEKVQPPRRVKRVQREEQATPEPAAREDGQAPAPPEPRPGRIDRFA